MNTECSHGQPEKTVRESAMNFLYEFLSMRSESLGMTTIVEHLLDLKPDPHTVF